MRGKKLGENFKALITSQKEDGTFENIVKEKLVDHLPNGELLVRVEYSSLNYKDALSAIGNKGVTREYPHTPGIDAAGIIEESSSPDFSAGNPLTTPAIITPSATGKFICSLIESVTLNGVMPKNPRSTFPEARIWSTTT